MRNQLRKNTLYWVFFCIIISFIFVIILIQNLIIMKSIKYLIISIVLLSFIGCSNNDDDSESVQTATRQFVSVNSSNPLLLRIEKENNTVIEYYGEKDSNGKALNCNLISVKTSEADEPIYTKIDNEGRPTKVFGSDGSSISFNYENINDVRIEVVTSNGENRLNFPLNDYRVSNKTSSKFKKNNARIGKKIKLLDKSIVNSKTQSSCNISNLSMQIDKCNEPFNYATVILLAKGVDVPSYQARYESRSDGNGNYCFLIDKPEPSSIQLDDICNSIENVLGNVCTGLEVFNTNPAAQLTLCATISSAFTVASLPVFTGCEVLINSMNLYCNTLGASVVPNAPSVLASLCNSDTLDESVPTEFVFKPAIYIDGGNYIVGDETNSFPTSGPFSGINLTIPSNPSIADFSTDPSDPNPEVDYVATAVIQCLENPSIATITVVGTDDYTDSITINLPIGNSTISLSVPGAEGGVKDYLSIVVENLSASTRVIIF